MHLIIDTDTAGDDVAALMMALASPDIELAGITINAGNVSFDQQVENALKTVEVMRRVGDIKVYPGATAPLLRPWVGAEYVHGSDGMGEAHFPAVRQRPETQHAVEFLIESSRRWAGDLVIVAQAPLTNLALAVRQDPGLASRVAALWVMGGTNNAPGNIEPLSEYNFYVDPEAAAIVFAAGFPLFMVGWDIALQASVLTRDDLRAIASMNTVYGQFFLQTQKSVIEFNQRVAHIDGTTHPDSLTMAMALHQDIWMAGASYYVGIETQGTLTRGVSVVDQLGVWKKPPNAQVCLRANGALFKTMLFDLLASGPKLLA